MEDIPVYRNNQVFSPENIDYLRKLLLQVGVNCEISSYGLYKTASIKNSNELSSINIDLNLRVIGIINFPILEVVDFYVSVNQVLLNEATIKDAFIKVLEQYARRLNFNEIHFIIDQDFERQKVNFYDSESALSADISFTLGTEAIHFIQNNYERCPYFSKFQDYQIKWQKKLI